MKKFALSLISVSALSIAMAAGSANASTIYLAPENDSNLYANNQIGFSPCCGDEPGGSITGAFGVGNTVTFATSGLFSLGTVDLFGYAGGGSLPIEVNLYAGANPNTGALLGSESVIPTGNGWTTEVFNFGGLTVPQTVTFIVSIVGNTGSYDDSYVDWQQFTGVSGSPTIGSSGDMWYGASGSYIADDSYAVDTGAETNTLAAEFNAAPQTPVPESGTLLYMLLAGAASFGVMLLSARDKVWNRA
jgi:hypothetical protein